MSSYPASLVGNSRTSTANNGTLHGQCQIQSAQGRARSRPGALAENLKKLAEHGFNVTAIDGVSAGEGRWGAILWVRPKDVIRAGRLLRAKTKTL